MYTQHVFAAFLVKLNEIEIQDVWVALAMVHTGFKRLTIIVQDSTLKLFKERVSGQLRSLVENIRGAKQDFCIDTRWEWIFST